MSPFNIIQIDPSKYKKEILSLWKINLPDTPEGRFEWMADNPEGPAFWYLAIHEKTGSLAGSISIMPRKMKINGNYALAGIVGDFMVGKEFQVFGPALQLIKIVIRNYQKLGFDFLYTYPNQASEKVALRAGFQKIGLVKRFAKPLKIKHQLNKYLKGKFVNLIAPSLELGLSIFSKEIYIGTKGNFSKINQLKSDYDSFWKKIKPEWPTLGDRSSRFISWRYFKNPFCQFQMFTNNDTSNGSILGYIIFTVLNNNVYIFDIFSDKKKDFEKILAKFLKVSKKAGYYVVSIRISDTNPLSPYIKSFGFSDRKEDNAILFAGDPGLVPREWVFFDGDRNI